jgi:hypothetical protein
MAAGVLLLGGMLGALVGRMATSAWRRREQNEAQARLTKLTHDIRGRLAVVRGEIDLVLGRPDSRPEERCKSAAAVVGEVDQANALLATSLPRPGTATNEHSNGHGRAAGGGGGRAVSDADR